MIDPLYTRSIFVRLLNIARKAAWMYRTANEHPKTCSSNLQFHQSNNYDVFILRCIKLVDDWEDWMYLLPRSSQDAGEPSGDPSGDILDDLEKAIGHFLNQKAVYDHTPESCDLPDQEGHQCMAET